MDSIAEFVRRPDLGRVGHSIKVRTNYFEITDLPFPKIYHYDIVIIPKVSPTSNRRIIQEAENSFSGVKAVFDGRRNVYAVRPFPFGDAHNLEVTMPAENDMNNVGIILPRVYKVIIRKVAEIDMREINRFLNGDCSISSNILTGIMALNVLIHHKPSKEHIPSKKSCTEFILGKKSDSVFELETNDISLSNLQHYLHVYRQKKSQLLILNQFPTY
ncbi:hypothetical protein RhiirA1_396753 [Rhizophagus irregularis]|uniref:Protein argonaute N-terminal domain-containing protein n=1 Tax=Rhizophagus irregularis TaxID=588596 RepID=A0A2N0RJP1_9GLOM|nr:hypothetical protein RhiirA1_396753 [Rhizophagus irregularis]